MKIFITGGDGRIGNYLLNNLSKAFDILTLGRNSRPKSKNRLVKYYQGDIRDTALLEDILIKERPDIVIHLAALHGNMCEKEPQLTQQVNVLATKTLAQLACKYKIKKFIFTSTSSVYNSTKLESINETKGTNPMSVYGKSKLDAENELGKLRCVSMEIVILRIFNIYGELFNDSLVFKLTHSKKDNPVKIIQPNLFYRDYIHISDVHQAIVCSINSDQPSSFEIYNIGSGRAINTNQLINEIISTGFIPNVVEERNTNPVLTVSWADISKAKKLLKFRPHLKLILD